MVKKATAIVPTMLRIREGLRKRLELEAKKNGRSLNAEMTERLERSYAADEWIAILQDQLNKQVHAFDKLLEKYRLIEVTKPDAETKPPEGSHRS
jgi:hypothetical protein